MCGEKKSGTGAGVRARGAGSRKKAAKAESRSIKAASAPLDPVPVKPLAAPMVKNDEERKEAERRRRRDIELVMNMSSNEHVVTSAEEAERALHDNPGQPGDAVMQILQGDERKASEIRLGIRMQHTTYGNHYGVTVPLLVLEKGFEPLAAPIVESDEERKARTEDYLCGPKGPDLVGISGKDFAKITKAVDDKGSFDMQMLDDILGSLGPTPSGQGAPCGTGVRLAYVENNICARKMGGSVQENYAKACQYSEEKNWERVETELRESVARYMPRVQTNGKSTADMLWSMLSFRADARNSVVTCMDREFGDDPLVGICKSPGKGEGVFARRSIPKGKFFTTYPCCGLFIPSGTREESHARLARGEPGDHLMISPMLYPLMPQELNLDYAINVPVPNHVGRMVQIVGHASNRHGMCCGHLINDAYTVDQAGGVEAYNSFDASNCTGVWNEGTLLMKTTRDVPMGQELLFTYSSNYWQDRGQHGLKGLD